MENLTELSVHMLNSSDLLVINGGSQLGYYLGYIAGTLGKGLSMPGAVDIAMDLFHK